MEMEDSKTHSTMWLAAMFKFGVTFCCVGVGNFNLQVLLELVVIFKFSGCSYHLGKIDYIYLNIIFKLGNDSVHIFLE